MWGGVYRIEISIELLQKTHVLYDQKGLTKGLWLNLPPKYWLRDCVIYVTEKCASRTFNVSNTKHTYLTHVNHTYFINPCVKRERTTYICDYLKKTRLTYNLLYICIHLQNLFLIDYLVF